MISDIPLPRIAVTTGEPAGIGPDIVIAAAQQSFNAELIVIADPDLLIDRARQLQLPLQLLPFQPDLETVKHKPGRLLIQPVVHTVKGVPGQPHTGNAGYVLETLKMACQGCLNGLFDSMVTAPVHKGIINDAGYSFTGHTEFLADLCDARQPVMLLMDKTLRVALLTTHLPLSKVSSAVTPEKLESVLHIIHHDLQKWFSIQLPRILVCGVNPHAGESGHLGREEIEIMIPIIKKLQGKGMDISGPVPADTAFTKDRLDSCDVVLTIYHDQGLPVLKSRGFGEIVNMTLGLPVIRTSVDHGTAFNLAGTGKAKCSSLVAALLTAIELCRLGNVDHSYPGHNHEAIL